MRATTINTLSQSPIEAREVFADPVSYLEALGINAELITEITSEHPLTLPAAA